VKYHFATFLIATLVSGCSINSRECGALFDTLRGKGPILLDSENSQAAATKFLYQSSQSSPTLGDLVTSHGAPEAISVEREFLQPNRLRLFYPADGQVLILDQVGQDWSISGSEPLAAADVELLDRQRQVVVQPVTGQRTPLQPVISSSNSQNPSLVEAKPVDFRGRLDSEKVVLER